MFSALPYAAKYQPKLHHVLLIQNANHMIPITLSYSPAHIAYFQADYNQSLTQLTHATMLSTMRVIYSRFKNRQVNGFATRSLLFATYHPLISRTYLYAGF